MSWISEDDIKAIRQQADIVDVMSRYITLEKKGKDYKAICPFHDDHDPSLSISTDKQIFSKSFILLTSFLNFITLSMFSYQLMNNYYTTYLLYN